MLLTKLCVQRVEKGKTLSYICKYSPCKKTQVSIVHPFWVGSDIYDEYFLSIRRIVLYRNITSALHSYVSRFIFHKGTFFMRVSFS